MYETFEVEGGYGFRIGSLIQEFYPFREGFQPMTREEAEYIAQCFDTPAGVHWTGDEVVPRLVLLTDKPRIVADDADTATITATIADPANTDAVTFEMDGHQLTQAVPENGEVRLLLTFAPGNEGRKEIVAHHSRFGRNAVVLEVASGGQ